MKEQEGERRKRRRVNSSEGAVWLGQVETHTVTGRGGQGAQREWMRGEGWGGLRGEEYQAPARDRLQHAGFDRMAPPGAGNTKPCDYPKHTGSDWVSEPVPFPTRLVWTVWGVRFLLGHSAESTVFFRPLQPKKLIFCTCHLPTTSLSATSLVFTQKQNSKKCWHALVSQGSWTINKALGKNFLWFWV